MSNAVFSEILQGIYDNEVVPYLGPGVLFDVTDKLTGAPIPADSDSLILAMQAMAPKLMDKFPQAAMDQELKHGLDLNQFLDKIYKHRQWTRAAIHDWLVEWRPDYVIDINRDTQLLDSYADEEHTLIVGGGRINGSNYHFKTYNYNGKRYSEVDQSQVDPTFPMLFKPLGCPVPESNYIATDADYIELTSGFFIPDFLKEYREGKKYVLLGVSLNCEFECRVLSEIVYGAPEHKGWFLRKNPTPKEKHFAKYLGFDLVEADCLDFLNFLQPSKLSSFKTSY